ncbi:MAG: SPOR domain-containing protein [Bacteroidetes bacterium]|nr:SPOR domain-containing protein [Bacteroidota bacterium]MCH8523248.1 SPOR domain-containing protein [Balneolales bacterium]
MVRHFILAISCVFAVYGCSTTEVLKEPVPEEAETRESMTEEFHFGFDIDDFRIRPTDAFFSVENEIPEIFQPDSTLISESARNAGFRIQIISSQDVREVEELRRKFNQWIFEEIPQYDPETYILFRQPFFRLRVGNFRSRAEAIEFNNIVKRKFPESWVVHDQIDPENITHRISLESNAE